MLAALVALLLSLPALAAAPTFPPLTGPVTDAANVLPPATVAELDSKLAALQAATGTQLVVATVPSLQGYEIEEYGYQLGRAWGIGQKGKNNGALLIVAPNERKVRIESGYGLEGTLTDALTRIIIADTIVPKFKAGDMAGGVVAGTDALIALLQLPPGEQAKAAQAAAQTHKARGPHISFGTIVWIVIILIWIVSSVSRGRRGRSFGSGVIWGAGLGGWGGGGDGGGWGGGGGGGGGFSGGGGSFGGGGSSGSW